MIIDPIAHSELRTSCVVQPSDLRCTAAASAQRSSSFTSSNSQNAPGVLGVKCTSGARHRTAHRHSEHVTSQRTQTELAAHLLRGAAVRL